MFPVKSVVTNRLKQMSGRNSRLHGNFYFDNHERQVLAFVGFSFATIIHLLWKQNLIL